MNNELDVTHIENMLSGIKHQKFHVVQSTTKNSIALLGKTWNTHFRHFVFSKENFVSGWILKLNLINIVSSFLIFHFCPIFFMLVTV